MRNRLFVALLAGLTIDAEGECSSACPIMLAGGIRRLVGPQARLNVHSMGMEQGQALP
jgi:hypothetical protein